MNYEFLSKIAMDNLDFICYITDIKTNNLIYLNKTARKLFAVNEADYAQKKCYEVLHSYNKPCSFCDNFYLKKDIFLNFEITLSKIAKNYSIHSTLIEVDNQPSRLCIGYDISHFIGQLGQLESKLDSEQTLLSCISAFNKSKNINEAIESLLSIVGKYFNAQRVSLFEVDYRIDTALHIYEWTKNESDSISKIVPKVPLKSISSIFEAFRNQGQYIVKDIHKELTFENPLFPLLNSIGVRSISLVPLGFNENPPFFLGVDNPTRNLHNIDLLHSVALFIHEETKKSQFIQRLEIMSYTDSLTGIYNRNKFNQKIKELENTKLKSLGLIHVDANSLKKINDLYGSEYGDDMLINITNALLKFIPIELYRIAGDEFIGFCLDIEHDDFENMVQNIRKTYANNPDFPFAIGGIWQNKNIDINLAIQQSGEIMLAEKQHYYKNLSDTLQYSSHSTEIILKEIRDNLYDIYLQAKIDLITGEIAGAEALIRKFSENGKIIPPDKFIPIYENEGTIRFLDFHVLERVCQFLQEFLKIDPHFKIAVNFSRVTFIMYDFVDEIIKICNNYSIPHYNIKIEITESIDKMDIEFFARKLTALHKAGFEVSLDDFGAKHSNLMMLARAEFTEVKIDKGLVDNIATNAQNKTIIRNIIKIIKELGTSVCVAEGIETLEQKEILQELGCTYGQGYYFYRPLPIKDFLIAYEKNEHKSKLQLSDVTKEYLDSFNIPHEISQHSLNIMPLGFNLWNDRKETVLCNDTSLKIFELASQEEYLTNFFFLSTEFQPNGKPTSESVLENLNEVRYQGETKFYWSHCNLKGEVIPSEIILKKINIATDQSSDFVVGYTRDLREQLEDYHNGNTPEKYFYNEISTQTLLNTTADMSHEILWNYNNKTQTIKFYGTVFEELKLAHKKISLDDTALFDALIFNEDRDLFDDFILALKVGLSKEFSIRFILANKTIQKYKIVYKSIFDENASSTHCVGKMLIEA